MNKIVIVINGQGGSGKDTVCSIMGKYYKVKNVSTVDPIKDIAKYAGWQGEKNDKSRKMLADLKQVFIEYCDLPLNYIIAQEKEFLSDDNEIMFVHCREGEEIAKIVKNSIVKAYTLLIRRNDSHYMHKHFGNLADDDVENYSYDFVYDGNNETIEDLERDFMAYFNNTIKIKL